MRLSPAKRGRDRKTVWQKGVCPLKKFRDVFGKIVTGLNYIGLAACFATVFIVAIDVILRKVSGARVSIKGSNELSAYFLVVICMLAIPAFQVKKGHIWVNMFVDMFPAKLRTVWLAVVHLIEFAVVALFTYGGVLKLQNFLDTGTATDVLNMPKWPFALVCLIGFLELAILLCADTILLFMETGKAGKNLSEGN